MNEEERCDMKDAMTAPRTHAQQLSGSAVRLRGDAALLEAIQRLRQEADRLEALLQALPRALPLAADEALWSMAIRIGRG